MKKTVFCALAIILAACTKPETTETTETADTTVAELIEDPDADTTYTPRGDMDDHESMMSEFSIENQSSYVSDPFEFSLDTTTLKDLLGKGTVIQAIETEAGEDEEGTYDGYTYFTVTSPDAELKFYSYSGKHYADIRTPALTMRNGIKVGMSRKEFLDAMGMDPSTDENMEVADAYRINDDYGSILFYFMGNTLESVNVNYEEGD